MYVFARSLIKRSLRGGGGGGGGAPEYASIGQTHAGGDQVLRVGAIRQNFPHVGPILDSATMFHQPFCQLLCNAPHPALRRARANVRIDGSVSQAASSTRCNDLLLFKAVLHARSPWTVVGGTSPVRAAAVL